MPIKSLQPTFTVKLILVVVAAILGVVVLATVTWRGLDNIQQSSQFVFKVGHGKDQIRQLQLRMIQLQSQGDQQIRNMEQEETVKLQTLLDFIEDPQARKYLQDIQTELKNYSRQLLVTHQVEQQLGTDDTGLVSELNRSGAQLEEALTGKRSALRQLTKMRQIEKEFLLSPGAEAVSKLDSQLKQLERAAKRARAYVPNKTLFQQFEQQLESMKELAISYFNHNSKLNQLQEKFGTLVIDTLNYMENDLQVVAQQYSDDTVKKPN